MTDDHVGHVDAGIGGCQEVPKKYVCMINTNVFYNSELLQDDCVIVLRFRNFFGKLLGDFDGPKNDLM